MMPGRTSTIQTICTLKEPNQSNFQELLRVLESPLQLLLYVYVASSRMAYYAVGPTTSDLNPCQRLTTRNHLHFLERL
jgi:hypothetical protein